MSEIYGPERIKAQLIKDPPDAHRIDCHYRLTSGTQYTCDCGYCESLKFDPTNHPPYYASLTPEPITVIESWGLGFHLGCAVKYIARAGKKDGAPIVQDLEKARWYLSREIERLKNKADEIKPSNPNPGSRADDYQECHIVREGVSQNET